MQSTVRDWRLADLHQLATGRGVRVEVIDSRVDAAHPDLARQLEVSRNFTTNNVAFPERHGTGVAGVIAARANNGQGIVGVAPDVRLMALRACVESDPGRSPAICDSLSLAKALIFAINHDANIVNLSLSGPPALLLGKLLGKLLDIALARGTIIVAAFDRTLADGGFPASHARVVAVASESGATPGFVYVAPGRDILTTEPGAAWGLANGSSYAAAHVSGLFALLRERGPIRSKALALASARERSIDPCASLLQSGGACDCACPRGIASAAAQR
jgi:subtilisin family serine protease